MLRMRLTAAKSSVSISARVQVHCFLVPGYWFTDTQIGAYSVYPSHPRVWGSGPLARLLVLLFYCLFVCVVKPHVT
eukprot:2247873-Rhodomonas_salina.1